MPFFANDMNLPILCVLSLTEASDHGAVPVELLKVADGCGRYRTRESLIKRDLPLRGTTTKREPISNGEDQLSHLHKKELRRWNVELR